jgi:uncharacterized repeat protein (TIGR01451 family)
MNIFCRTIFIAVTLFTLSDLRAQIWILELPQAHNFISSMTAIAPDGSIIVTDSRNSPDSIYVSKVSENGSLIWQKQYLGGGIAPTSSPQKIGCGGIYFEPDGSIYLLANRGASSGQGFNILHIDENGNEISSVYNGTNGWVMRTLRQQDGDFIITRSPGFGLRKLKPDGTSVWTQNNTGGFSANFTNTIAQADNGDFLLALPGFGAGITGNAIFHTNNDGVFINAYPSQITGGFATHNICKGANGNFLNVSTNTAGEMLRKIITVDGTILFSELTNYTDLDVNDILALPDGYLLAGHKNDEIYIWRLDLNGNIIYQRGFNNVFNQNGFFSSLALVSGTTEVVGSGSVGNSAAESDAFVMKFDANIDDYSLVQGKVRIDLQSDCLNDLTEMGKTEIPLLVASLTDTFYTMTNAAGDYRFSLDSGTYTIQVIDNHPYIENCTGPILLQIGSGDTILQDFWMKELYNCPLLQVSLSAPNIRRCFVNTYAVQYKNLGISTAENSEVHLVLDPLLNFLSSSFPPQNAMADTLVFEVGNLAPGESGLFYIDVDMDNCNDLVLGQSICSSVKIYPDQICGDFSNWAGASMAVGGICDGDSVKLFVTNRGVATTSQNLEYIVTEDNVILMMGNGNFNPSDTIWIKQPANGSTWRITSEQEPNHAGNSMPSVSLEGCGPNFSTGFVSMFPTDDANFSEDIECKILVGAFDPNEKSAFPIGYESAHYIERGAEIEYLVQFQNTGNDTAFTVVIRDTLSNFLDPTSIQIGAASHNFTWSLEGKGILIFKFSNILLPDSNVNEAASHGWLRFRIAQKPSLNLGTRIENQAAIFFDFNSPIFTGTVFHTIGEKFIKVSLLELNQNLVGNVQVFPNPTQTGNHLFFKNEAYNNLTFRLFDVFGREIFSEKIQSGRVFLPNSIGKGIFVFQIEASGISIGRGKLVAD